MDTDAEEPRQRHPWAQVERVLVTVAAVSVSINSTLIGAAAAAPSKSIPHATTIRSSVEGVAICNRVLIDVPVVTGTNAAVVGCA
jgi:hypothetical protein